jgi:hypothetical protein
MGERRERDKREEREGEGERRREERGKRETEWEGKGRQLPDFEENLLYKMTSGAAHLTGNSVFFAAV